ncbi:MAG: cupin domain-containing protein [Chloroflexi bacterium]|nr:cupin domain-containing protein [Chloroflexota bacterium]
MYTNEFRSKVLLRSEQSNGQVAIVEGVAAAHWEGPPLHHHDFDEGFYVLEGELTVEVNGERHTARPGDFAFAPRGSHHALANVSDAPARYVLVITPAGFERYFDLITAEQTGVDPPPEALKPRPRSTVVGPPLGGRRGDA